MAAGATTPIPIAELAALVHQAMLNLGAATAARRRGSPSERRCPRTTAATDACAPGPPHRSQATPRTRPRRSPRS